MPSAIVTTDSRYSREDHPQLSRQLHSMAWDPSNPSALLIVSSDNANDTSSGSDVNMDSNDHRHIQFHTWYSDTGSVNGKVSPIELTSLLRLISDYETRLQQQHHHPMLLPASTKKRDGNAPPHQSIVPYDSSHGTLSYREQSQLYRNSVTDFLLTKDEDDNDQLLREEKGLLHQVNSLLYLSEIYLLPPFDVDLEETYDYYYSDGTVRHWFDCPGIATADTIRFLRQFVLPPPPSKGRRPHDSMNSEGDEDTMVDVLDDDEDYLGYNKYSDFPTEEAYWDYLLLFCKCGYLHFVWYLLQTHPWCAAAMRERLQFDDDSSGTTSNDDRINRAALQSMINDWEQIGSVLMTAPIPGGRGWSSAITEPDVDDTALLSDYDMELTYVDGLNVLHTDYQHWEIPSSSNSFDHATNGDQSMIYEPEIAKQKHQLWSDYAKYVRTRNSLCQKSTHIDAILQLLSGDYGSRQGHHQSVLGGRSSASPLLLFESWAEQLCCDLLYRTPDLRPRSIAARAAVIMDLYHHNNNNYNSPYHRTTSPDIRSDRSSNNNVLSPEHRSSSSLSAYEASIVAIMQGNAGRTIAELYDLGGGSGAAVPMTLLAVVFDLFVEAKIIPQESIEKRFTFLIEASSSIVASLRISHPDIGVQLAIRLLLPHVTVVSSSSVRGEVVGAISNILEHYTPTTHHYARTALSLCVPFLSTTEHLSNNQERQWQRMLLDGCVSVFIQFYRNYERTGTNIHTEEDMSVLFEGIDLESEVLPQPWLGTCYRFLEAECYKTVLSLLRAMAGSSTRNENDFDELQQVDHLCIVKAEPMSKVIKRYVSSTIATTNGKIGARTTYQFNSTHRLPNVALLLMNVVEMFTLFLEDSSHNDLAKCITSFLSRCSSVSSSSSISLQWWMLRVACCLIEQGNDIMFDENDVTILLQHLSEVKSCAESFSSGDADNARSIGSVSEQIEMQVCFHGLLLKTMCTKNSIRQKRIYSDKCAQEKKQIVHAMLLD